MDTSLLDTMNNAVWKVHTCVKDVIFARNSIASTARLLFLKYAVDNYLGANTKDDMFYYAQVQKMFAQRYIEGGPNAIYPVLLNIDQLYGFDDIISKAMDYYVQDLFGYDSSWHRKNASDSGFKILMGIIAELDLEEKGEKNAIGKVLVQIITAMMNKDAKSNMRIGDYISNDSVSKLVSKILNVQDDDVFCDFTAGAGLSTVTIVGEALATIVNGEINAEQIRLAAMLYIMSGWKKIKLHEGDSLSHCNENIKGNKIFIDPPLAGKIFDDKDGISRDTNIVAIQRTLEYLSDKGLAVVTVPGKILFGTNKQCIELRHQLVDMGYLKAVIALPPCWYGVGVNTNLLLLSKNSSERFVLVNATNSSDFYQKDKRTCNLTVSGIDKIADIVNNCQSMDGISVVLSAKELREDYNLVPTQYVKVAAKKESLTIEEIDSTLTELYAKLLKNIK